MNAGPLSHDPLMDVPYRPILLGGTKATVEYRSDGSVVYELEEALEPYPARLTERNRRSGNRLCVGRRSRGRRRTRCLRHGGGRSGRTEVRSDGDGLSDRGGRPHVGSRQYVLGGDAPVRAAPG